MKILWIDDEQHLLNGFKLLMRDDHKVTTLTGPILTEATVEATKPDVVIIDGLRNSDRNGVVIAKILRKDGHKVGICSGDAIMELEAKRQGIPFMWKPATKDEMLEFIEVVKEG